MVFKCQEDSFLKEFTSKVVKCDPTTEPIVEYGKTSKFEGYSITLENTILFPAGGGQPHDHGYLNNVEVLQVLRKGEEALHFTKEPIEVGTTVAQTINWERRFDHMQQHSGQHLLSAILEREHSLPTTSWWLGAHECYVELAAAAAAVPHEVIAATEDRCNQLIREAVPVVLKICKADDPSLDKAHTKGLPEDCTDSIRIITIPNVDENLCCGTHVTNLSQLQVIKLLGAEPGKKGKTNLRFVVGSRVTRTMQVMLEREAALTALLKNEPSKHEELVQKVQKNLKITNKNLQNVLSELAHFEVQAVKANKPKYLFMFKKEGTPDFNRAVMKGLEGEGMFLVLISEEPDKPKEGQVVVQGPEDHCRALGQQITDLLKGKGAFKNGRFQGKAGDLGGVNKCKKLVEEYFNNV